MNARFDWTARLQALVAQAKPHERRAFVSFSLVEAIKAAQPQALTPPALALLGELTKAAGVTASDAPAVLLQKLDAHLAANAPPAWMLQEYEALTREATLAGQGSEVGAAFASFAGTEAGGILGGGARPGGTTPGGALAQMAFRSKPKK